MEATADGDRSVRRSTDVQRLVEWLDADFGVRCSMAAPVEGGSDRFAKVWRATDQTGRSLAVKWTVGGSESALEVAAELSAAGIEGVVGPLAARDGRLWSHRGGRRLVVLPWRAEPPATSTTFDARHWTTFGRMLAAVHATRPSALPRLPASDGPHRRMRRAVAELHHQLGTQDGGINHPTPDDGLVLTLRHEAAPLLAVVDSLLVGIDRLHAAGTWQGHEGRIGVCHADPHLGNLLAGDDGSVWLLDWDDAVRGPPEQDLLFVLDGGVLGSAPVTADQTAAFAAGYGSLDVDPHALAYHRGLRALEDLVDFALEVLRPDRHSATERQAALGYVLGNLAPGGLTEAALRSLRDTGTLSSSPRLRRTGE